jgi:DNA-binding Lrp family transcriptional regulator
MSVDHIEPAAHDAAGKTTGDAAITRIVTRLSGEYVLRAFQLVIDSYGDIRLGLMVLAINAANTAIPYLTRDGQPVTGADGSFPDDLRRPISISRLADTTGLPFESARRIVGRLVDTGICVHVEGGVIVPRSVVLRSEIVRNIVANVDYVRKFVRDLEAVGLVEERPGNASAANRAGDDVAIARDVTGPSMDYVLRALQLLAAAYGDVRAGIVAQTIVTANTVHLDTRTGNGWRYAGEDEPPPDEVRRPISVGRLAESLGLPYETMRRHVRRLIDAGVCVRVERGLIVPQAVLEQAGAAHARLTNVSYVRKFVRDLHAIGL